MELHQWLKLVKGLLDCEVVEWVEHDCLLQAKLRYMCCGVKAGTDLLMVSLRGVEEVSLRVYYVVREDGVLVRESRCGEWDPRLGGFDAMLDLLLECGYGRYRIGGL